jgi:hypothetical protein
MLGTFALLGTRNSQAEATAASTEWQWTSKAPANVDFQDVFMASTESGIAVGKDGDRGAAYELQWTGVDETESSLAMNAVGFDFRAPLWAAVMVNEDVWVVGEQGLIAHKQNGTWSEVAGPVPGAQLVTLQMLGNGEEGWAAGFIPPAFGEQPEPVLLHYTNGQWQRDESISGEGSINALHFAPGGGWAVGGAGIWHYRNGEWNKEQAPNPCPETGCYPTYNAVRAVNGDEAWIAGENIGLCGICVPMPYVLHSEGGTWHIIVQGRVQGDPTREGAGREINAMTFSSGSAKLPARAWAVGTVRGGKEPGLEPYILSHDDALGASDWQYIPYPAGLTRPTELTGVSAPDRDHAVAVGTRGTILSFGYGSQPSLTATPTSTTGNVPTATQVPGGSNPAERVGDPHNPNITYFAPVGHTLGGVFRDYWQQHGGLAQFGYPLTEEFSETSSTDGKTYVTQYFERARFEHHPENAPPYNVLLGLLGRTVTAGREGEQVFQRTPNYNFPGSIYFEVVGHNVPAPFANYWQQHGGLPVYGYPITESYTEISLTDGKLYTVQYFERNRFEYHPELREPYSVSLGLLGVQILRERGWIH